MRVRDRVVGWPHAYRLIQVPFAEAKFAPVRAHNDLSLAKRVLDVACGPGINTRYFSGSDYLGVDINERYVAYARRRYGRDFLVADATQIESLPGEPFDFILVNGFLHHIPDSAVEALLSRLASALSPDGRIHVVDIVPPERQRPLSRLLYRFDRGNHLRSLEAWRRLFSANFAPEILEPYPVGLAGKDVATAVYFRGRHADRPA